MASIGQAIVNSGNQVFVYNNFNPAVIGTVSGNTNGLLVAPYVQGMDPQAALQMTGRNPGGASYRAPVNSVVAAANNTNAVIAMIGGDLGAAVARMGFTKGGAFLCNALTNGTSAVTVPLTNTQTQTNAFWGDTSFTTVYAMILQNFNNVDGVSSGNAAFYVNGSATNGAVLGLNTNGTYAIPANGSTVLLAFPQGIAIAAATANMLITPVNGGVFACAVYGA